MGDARGDAVFTNTERFTILRRLGSGGMGVVYAAHDRQRDHDVALKTLTGFEPTRLYRFKREFRSIASVTHRNLVTLYELVAEDDAWFFTMELLDGCSFLDYVRPARTVRLTASDDTAPTADLRAAGHGGVVNEPRLRAALRQLAEGLCALHKNGYLHRDVKPSNVHVTTEGRVVVLDFGLVAELSRGADTPELMGTPAYMAPEQAVAITKLTPACDWYAVGVMLYQALTGRRPFEGPPELVLRAKQRGDGFPPSASVRDVPADLDELCAELLRCDPAQRPTGEQVLARLRRSQRPSTSPAYREDADNVELVGRSSHLAALRGAFERTQSGQGVILLVHGTSGAGKSELVRRFLDGVATREDAVVLEGKCYARESVPFKGVDSLVDSLSQFLMRLPRHEADLFMPRDVIALGQLMPVLRRVESIRDARRKSHASADPHELRRQAFRALRDMLANIAEQRALVLFIDDLQWGDADSGSLLAEIMRPPDVPPMLLIGAYRSEDADTAPMVRTLLRREKRLGPASTVQVMEIDRLSEQDARSLAVRLSGGSLDPAAVEAVTAESGGNPYFIHELVRFAQSDVGRRLGADVVKELRLEQVVLRRVAQLGDASRRLLEVLSVAARPLSHRVAHAAADVDPSAMEVLRNHRLVRTRGTRDLDNVEPYHDRIREVVAAALPPETLRATHRVLARSLEQAEEGDPETLAQLWEGAAELERAGEYYAAAAGRASESLAFGRAAALYGRALEVRPRTGAEGVELRVALADSLTNAGRGVDAAQAYFDAAEDADPPTALRCRGRGAEELLRSGYIDRGLDLLDEFLSEVGMKLPRRPLSSLLIGRLLVRLRGLRFKERRRTQITLEDRTRVDLCWSTTVALGFTDNLLGASFQARHLREALRVGDVAHVSLALDCEMVYAALAGPSARRRVRNVQAHSARLIERTEDPLVKAHNLAATALVSYQFGDFLDAHNRCARALQTMRQHCTGVAFLNNTVEIYHLWTLYYLGAMGELSRRVPALLRAAEERGDRYLLGSLCTGLPHTTWLVLDDPEMGEHVAGEAMRVWSRRRFHLQHFWYCLAQTQALIYQGDGPGAVERCAREWKPIVRSLLFRIERIRLEAFDVRARAVLTAGAHESGSARRAAIAQVRADARRIEGDKTRLGKTLAHMRRAGAAALAEDLELVRRELELAIETADDCNLELNAACARRRLGEILGGDEGAALRDSSDEWMRGQNIVDLDRMCALVAPGFPE